MSSHFEEYLEVNSYSQRSLSTDEIRRSKSRASFGDSYDSKHLRNIFEDDTDTMLLSHEFGDESITEKMWTKVLNIY